MLLQLSSLPHYLWQCQYGSQRRASIGCSPLRSTVATDDALVVIVVFTVKIVLNMHACIPKIYISHNFDITLAENPVCLVLWLLPACPSLLARWIVQLLRFDKYAWFGQYINPSSRPIIAADPVIPVAPVTPFFQSLLSFHNSKNKSLFI